MKTFKNLLILVMMVIASAFLQNAVAQTFTFTNNEGRNTLCPTTYIRSF